MKFSQATYFLIGAYCWLMIAFGSSASLGFRFRSFDPGEIVTKISFILFYFASCYFFIWMAKKAKEQEFQMPSDDEAKKIIEDFKYNGKKKKNRKV